MHKSLDKAKNLCIALMFFGVTCVVGLDYFNADKNLIVIVMCFVLFATSVFGFLTLQRITVSHPCFFKTDKSMFACREKVCHTCNVSLISFKDKDKPLILGKALPLALEHRFWRWM